MGGSAERASTRRREGGGQAAGAAGTGTSSYPGRAQSTSRLRCTGSSLVRTARPSEGRRGPAWGRRGDLALPSPTTASDVDAGPRPSAGAARPPPPRVTCCAAAAYPVWGVSLVKWVEVGL